MLQIQESLMTALSQAKMDRFVHRLMCRLRDEFSDQIRFQKLNDEEIEPMVRRGISEAETYNVVLDKDIELYVECMVLLNPEFDRDPNHRWAGEILTDKDICGSKKMDRINGHLLFGPDGAR